MYAQNHPHRLAPARALFPVQGLAAVLLTQSLPAHALLLRACRPNDSPLFCRLESVLTFLYAAAIILGILLIAAVLAAVRAYKRKAQKLRPEEITPDAP